MINRMLIALGIRKKSEKVESEITEAYATGKLPKRTTYVGKGKVYMGGKGGEFSGAGASGSWDSTSSSSSDSGSTSSGSD